MPPLLPYDALVFAGGGCRCFWQVGFLKALALEFEIRPKQAAAVSAGAAMACMLFGNRIDEVFDHFCELIEQNDRNVYPSNLLRGVRIFPHERMYRDTILHCCDDAALETLRAGPELRVLLARLPSGLGPRLGVATALLVYQGEKLLTPRVHPKLALRLGFRPEVVSMQTCSTPEQVADLILHSSCTPPMTPVFMRDGAAVLDGGLIDSVPVDALAPGAKEVLVLLSRPYPEKLIPKVAGYTYVQPSAPIPVRKWDYTNPTLVRATLELGRRDGERFAAALSAREDGHSEPT